jgi:hypothetical protein
MRWCRTAATARDCRTRRPSPGWSGVTEHSSILTSCRPSFLSRRRKRPTFSQPPAQARRRCSNQFPGGIPSPLGFHGCPFRGRSSGSQYPSQTTTGPARPPVARVPATSAQPATKDQQATEKWLTSHGGATQIASKRTFQIKLRNGLALSRVTTTFAVPRQLDRTLADSDPFSFLWVGRKAHVKLGTIRQARQRHVARLAAT